MNDPAPVLTERRGGLGVLTLNRPKAINALTHQMVQVITAALNEWAKDPSVDGVAITGAGERGLCAGGDIVAFYNDAVNGTDHSIAFWRDEYRMNALIADYPKPYLALMDGIVLGGGVGVSAHAEYRVVTERSRIGMPEVGIGLIPDVGGTWLLSHAPGELGTYAALTGDQFGAADAIELDLADVLVSSDRLPALLDRATEIGIPTAVAEFAEPVPDAPLAAQREWIDQAFGHDEVGEILAAVDDDLRTKIASKSPSSLVLTLRALRSARHMNNLTDALDQEFAIVSQLLRSHDLREGIRAQVIDKDRNPMWAPPAIDVIDLTP